MNARRTARGLLLTSADAAAAVGVSQATLREWTHRGLLDNQGSRRVALYDPEQLVAAMEAPKPRRATAPARRAAS